MSKRAISKLKEWFELEDKPTQQQFYDWLDSFWHKDAGTVITSFEELVGGDVRITLSDGQSFVVTATVDNSVPKVVIIEGWLVWKIQGIDPTIIENLDKIQGQRDANRFGTYEVLDATDLTIDANLRTITEDDIS